MNKIAILFLCMLGLTLPQHVCSAELFPISGPDGLSSFEISPDGRTIIGIANASLRDDGPNSKSKLFIWDVQCLLQGGADCRIQRQLPWFDSRFLYWRAGTNQFVVDSLTLQQIDSVAPFAIRDLKSLAIVRWPKVMRSDAPDPVQSSEQEVVESAIRYLSPDGRVALRLVSRDAEIRIAAPEREIVIPRQLYDLRTLMPNRYEIVVAGNGSGFYFWSGSLDAKGRLLNYAGRQRRSVPLPQDLNGNLQIVFPPSAGMAVAAFTADGVRALEYRGPLMSQVNDHVQAVRRARPGLELKAMRVSEDCETWALLFASISGAQELHVMKPATGSISTTPLPAGDLNEAGSLARLSSQYVAIPGRHGALPARHYALAKPGPKTLIIRFHGGPPVNAANDIYGWARRLSAMGLDVLDVDYRGSPGYGARHFLALKRPAAEVMKQDLKAALAWGRRHGYAQVGFLGTSAGGLAGAATLSAPSPRPDFMVLESPMIDLPNAPKDIACSRLRGQTTDRVFGFRELPNGQCEPYPTGLLNATRFANTPVFLLAGKRDLRTPYATTEAWVAKARAGGASCIDFVVSERGGHTLFDWPKPEEGRALLALKDWLSRLGARGACPSSEPRRENSPATLR